MGLRLVHMVIAHVRALGIIAIDIGNPKWSEEQHSGR